MFIYFPLFKVTLWIATRESDDGRQLTAMQACLLVSQRLKFKNIASQQIVVELDQFLLFSNLASYLLQTMWTSYLLFIRQQQQQQWKQQN